MMLGYLQSQNRVFLIDKAQHVISFKLLASVLQYQAAVLAGRLEDARALLGKIPGDQHGKVAKFLETTADLKEEAFNVTPDLQHKFDLALVLNKIDAAFQIAKEQADPNKWKLVGGWLSLTHSLSSEIWHSRWGPSRWRRSDCAMPKTSAPSSCSTPARAMSRACATSPAPPSRSASSTSPTTRPCRSEISRAPSRCSSAATKSQRPPSSRSYCPSQIPEVIAKWKEALVAKKPSVYSP